MKRVQKGQVMPVLLLVVLAVLIVTVISYNSSRATIAKMELVNAADGAAYSGAVQAARSMNFMAYTNRAMIANTIGAGYMVAYVSQLRHYAAAIDEISSPKRLMAKIMHYQKNSMRAQLEAFGLYMDDLEGADIDEDELDDDELDAISTMGEAGEADEAEVDPNLQQEMTDWGAANPAELDHMQAEAEQAKIDNARIGGNRYQRAGRFGGKILDGLATTIGQTTIPLIDIVNTAYAAVQVTEQLALANAIGSTMDQVVHGYGDDIRVVDNNAGRAFLWMVPVRPGIESSVRIPQEVDFDLGRHIRQRAARSGNPVTGVAGMLSGWALGALDSEGGIRRTDATSLGPMERMVIQSPEFDSGTGPDASDEEYMSYNRAWRMCVQRNPVSYGPPFVPIISIPDNPFGEESDFVTPPCTPPFVAPAFPGMFQMAIDKTGGSSFIMSARDGARSGGEILDKRHGASAGSGGATGVSPGGSSGSSSAGSEDGSTWGHTSDGSSVYTSGSSGRWGGIEVTPSTGIPSEIEILADHPDEQARRSGHQSSTDYRGLTEDSPARSAARDSGQQATQSFRDRIYGSALGQASGVEGLVSDLGPNAKFGADWQSEDQIRMGSFVWRPKFQNSFPFFDIKSTLHASKFELEGHELVWAGATAKEFYSHYQGIPLYMSLTELPWVDGALDNVLGRPDGRVIDVQVSRPVAGALLNLGFMDAPDDIEFQARARGEVFYYRQPHDDDNRAQGYGGEVYGYFPTPGVPDADKMSPFAGMLAEVLTGDSVEWGTLMKNWFGQKWHNQQISFPIMTDLIKPKIGIQEELPNLMTPFWDARLSRIG